MSVYGVHKLLKRIRQDPDFRDRLAGGDHSALDEYPLTDEEHSALITGEVGTLNQLGVHGYMLNTLARYRLFGLTPDRYMDRIRHAS